jgi:hypothetical protein
VRRVRTALAATICVTLATFVPASASATTIRLGPSLSRPGSNISCGVSASCAPYTVLQRAVPDATVTLNAPADGNVTSWSVVGSGKLKLRVLRPIGESVIAEGTSAFATDVAGGSNSTSLRIRAGDVIGINLADPSSVETIHTGQESAVWSRFEPPIPEDGLADAPSKTFSGESGEELLFNAAVVLTPSVAGLLPTSGQTTGGETVKIVGSDLDGATAVTFGSKPATFTIDSPNQITATAPSAPASTVDVTITGPGGTSAINAGDKYTFVAAPSPQGIVGPSLVSPLTTTGKPTLTELGQSASKWRRGHQQAKISRAPVGTTFSFNLSKAATVKLAFTQRASGRRVRGACKAPTPSNADKRKCTRTILAGTLSLPGHSGLNKLRFQGVLANGKSLKVGSYSVLLSARDSGGLQSAPQSLRFSIVG